MPNENHIERLMKNYERETPRVERQLSYARQVRQSWDRTPFDQQHVQDATVLQQAQELVAAQYIDEEFLICKLSLIALVFSFQFLLIFLA